MIYLQIISAILFLICIGSINSHLTRNTDEMMGISTIGKLLFIIIQITSFILYTSLVSDISGLKWYWSIIIAVILFMVFANVFSSIYSSILGYKSKPTLSLFEGGYVKHNLYIIDALITFVLGLILFLLT